MSNEELANIFTESIKRLAENPARLENLNLYLSYHFDEWVKKFANTAEDLTGEIKCFSEIEI
jgi:hypothetical protein